METLHLKLCGIVYIWNLRSRVYVYQWLLKSARFPQVSANLRNRSPPISNLMSGKLNFN